MEKKISIIGDFSTMKALEWKQQLNSFASNFETLEVDLTGVTEADIIGVNALVTTHKILLAKERQLKITVKKPSKMWEMLNLTKFMPIFKTVEI
jgi:ABC-type transporter Mla MlaB component